MKVRVTRLLFDGMKRRRPGEIIEISNDRWKAGENIPSNRKVGDVKAFSPSSMEVIDENVPSSINKKVSTSEAKKHSDEEVI